MHKCSQFLSRFIRSLPFFNPFVGCGETIALPFVNHQIPTMVVEWIYPFVMVPICYIMVFLLFGYSKGDNPFAGCVLFLLTYCFNSLTLKLLICAYPNYWLIVIILLAYFKICGSVSNRYNGVDVTYEHRMMSDTITQKNQKNNKND